VAFFTAFLGTAFLARNHRTLHVAGCIRTGLVCNLSPVLWTWTFLTRLNLYNNSLTRLSPEVARLQRLTYLEVSANKLRELPPQLGDIPALTVLQANNNLLNEIPWELGRLFKLQSIGRGSSSFRL